MSGPLLNFLLLFACVYTHQLRLFHDILHNHSLYNKKVQAVSLHRVQKERNSCLTRFVHRQVPFANL